MKSWLVALSGLCCLVSCKSERLLEPDPSARPSASAAKVAPTAPKPAAGPKLQFRKAAAGDVPTLVKSERAAADQNGRSLVVYVGATWCEPCQRFHEAAQKGELDAELPPITFLEFDADEDVPRLRPAGYASTYIPLFATPNADGRASGKFIEGGIKGQGAAKEIAPRLKKLLGV